MSRSPLAYPLTRGIDGDGGGAADLQTDIMRFMAILSLCLVAIFALVQSIPLAAEKPRTSAPPVTTEPAAATSQAAGVAAASGVERPAAATEEPRPVILKRPKWVPNAVTARSDSVRIEQPHKPPAPSPAQVPEKATRAAKPAPAATPPAPTDEKRGFTLRFESDIALTRLVAAGKVGFYAVEAGRAQRMAVSNSRISFWDASTPNRFHEMERSTVPLAVVQALERTGTDPATVGWGVTLPGRMQTALRDMMQENTGGALVIAADGELRLEPQ